MKAKLFLISILFLASNLCLFAQKSDINNRIDSLEQLLKTHSQDDTTKVNTLNQLIWEYRLINFMKALNYIEESEKIAKKIGFDLGLATAFSHKALIMNKMGNYIQSVETVLEALKIFEKINDKKGVATCFIQIGITKVRQGYYEQGIAEYRKAYDIFVEINDNYQQARTLNNMGNAFTAWQKPDSALLYLQPAKIILENLKQDFRYYVYYNQSVAYFQKKNYDLAEQNALRVIEYFEKNPNTSDKYIASKSYINLADIYFIRFQNIEKALTYLQKGASIAVLGKLKPEMQESYQKLANLYAQKKEFDSAYYFQSWGIEIKDSLAIKESQEKLLYAQEEYRKDKQSILVKLQKEEIDNQRLVSFGLLGMVALMVLALSFVFRSQKRIKKAYEKLNFAKIEIEQKSEELKMAFEAIEDKNLKIRDSITYAQRIQNALLPFQEKIETNLGKENFFILYKPRDVVSGDFYFFEQVGNKQIVVAADCTGHGVPGALMSMIGMNILEEIIVTKQITEANEILNQLDFRIRHSLKQNETRNRDGMDLAVCVIDKTNQVLNYAGAKNPFYWVQNQQFQEIKADKKSIGGHQTEEESSFTSHQIPIENENVFYLFSDGYQDQFGGEKNQKFMVKRFRELLFSIHKKPLSEQKEILETVIEDWKQGIYEQTDDILVIGVRNLK